MSNYKAMIAKVDTTIPIEGADRIQIAKILGESVIVSKLIKEGDVGVFFCAGTQLSEEFCKNNDLYRDSSKNSNPEASGFFDGNRRVRAQPFMKVRSEGYFAELSSLVWTGFKISDLKLGDTFEDLNGKNVCKKYVNPNARTPNQQKKEKKKKAVPTFVEHSDTAQFKYNLPKIEKGSMISIQSKIHGTSARYGYHKVLQKMPKWKEFLNKVVPLFDEEYEYEYVAGTRRVILDDPEKEGFHGKEQYRFDVLELLKPYLDKGMTVYGEIAGYANGKPIMSVHQTKSLKDKNFTKKYGKDVVYKYNCVEGHYRFHVYRITMTNDEGNTIDFTQQQIVKWCNDRGLIPAYDVIDPFFYDGDSDKLMTLVESLTERPEVLTEDYHDPSHVSEGVIIRIDNGNTTPVFFKNKSYAFKVLEGIASEKTVEVEDEA